MLFFNGLINDLPAWKLSIDFNRSFNSSTKIYCAGTYLLVQNVADKMGPGGNFSPCNFVEHPP